MDATLRPLSPDVGHLVLGRRPGQSVVITIPAGTVITKDIEISVSLYELRVGSCRLAVQAPRNFPVNRRDEPDSIAA